MGDLLVSIDKQLGGETWTNTHCFRMNGTAGLPTDADMVSLGVGAGITAANTSGSGMTNPLQRLLAYERGLHNPLVTLTRVYVTDGKRNATTDPDVFWSATISLAGYASNTGRTGTYAPGTVAMIVNRIPTGYNSRQGRLFIRGLLMANELSFNQRGGVDWASSTVAATVQGICNTSESASGIVGHYLSGTNAGVALYCIPHYIGKLDTTDKKQWGQIKGVTPIVDLSPSNPRNRQMLRGKKRKV